MFKLLLVLAIALPAFATERLIMVGGGDHPDEAVAALLHWSGGDQARILVIPWSSSASRERTLLKVTAHFKSRGLAEFIMAPNSAEMETQSALFYQQLDLATGVYFTGGDQNSFMAVVAKFPQVQSEFHRKMAEGVPFFGTSAGTAVMAGTMFTGDYNSSSAKVVGGELLGIDPAAVIMAPGLSMLRGILVDQHFFARRRQNRFWSAFSISPESTGLAIDESTAVILENQRWAKVVGINTVLAAKRGISGTADSVYHLKDGDSIDLACFCRKP